ncbi:MAG: B-box zinc finger protein [Mariprofundaceae bacterium]
MQEAVSGSEASKKRQPFSMKGTTIYCENHRASIATFYCASCHQPFCETCVIGEEREDSFCSTCSGQLFKKKKVDASKLGQRRRLLIICLGIAALIIIGINAYIIISNEPVDDPVDLAQLYSEKTLQLITCRQRLESTAKYVEDYHKAMGRLPDGSELAEFVGDDAKLLREPVSAEAYEIEARAESFRVYCPTPHNHGLAEHYADPRKPAKMIYGATGGE